MIRSTEMYKPTLTRRNSLSEKNMGRPITPKALRGIVRAVIEEDPSIDDSEWKERTKLRLVKQGWSYPTPEELGQAMTEVESRLSKHRGPRPVPIPEPTPGASTEVRPLSADEARAALSMLRERFGPLPSMKPREMPDPEPELMTTRERYALVSDIEKLRTIAALRRANRDQPRESIREEMREEDSREATAGDGTRSK